MSCEFGHLPDGVGNAAGASCGRLCPDVPVAHGRRTGRGFVTEIEGGEQGAHPHLLLIHDPERRTTVPDALKSAVERPEAPV